MEANSTEMRLLHGMWSKIHDAADDARHAIREGKGREFSNPFTGATQNLPAPAHILKLREAVLKIAPDRLDEFASIAESLVRSAIEQFAFHLLSVHDGEGAYPGELQVILCDREGRRLEDYLHEVFHSANPRGSGQD